MAIVVGLSCLWERVKGYAGLPILRFGTVTALSRVGPDTFWRDR